MNNILGIGIDLTQNIPVVSVCLCPPAALANGNIEPKLLAHNWPPITELRGKFAAQPPVALLPLSRGEPLMVADAAARHRRSAGFAWPPEAQVPYSEDARFGVGRIPLVAAWSTIVPQQGNVDSSMSRRDDHEFAWMPDGEKLQSARAGEILSRSIKAFLSSANVPFGDCLTTIVVPDALDEAGQQILLDNLKLNGFDEDKVHLLPRPLAAALYWCQTADTPKLDQVQAGSDEEGIEAGRLRVLTMSLDLWEAQSFELRARHQHGRVWLVPIRDRSRIFEVQPELPFPGLSTALALAQMNPTNDSIGWWARLFASDWLFQRLSETRPLNHAESDALADLRSKGPSLALRRQVEDLKALKTLWTRCFEGANQSSHIVEAIWQKQEKLLGISFQKILSTLATGSFAHLRGIDNQLIAKKMAGSDIAPQSDGYDGPARGAALAAAAISHKLPCYRETLLPLELFVSLRNELGDLTTDWKQLVTAQTIEAGKPWRSPSPVTGLQIMEGNKELWLPLKRSIHGNEQFRQVASELLEPTKYDEPVRIEVVVKPGQGFARVSIESQKPGVFSTRLDWRTMKECEKPEPPPLTYLPGVSRIVAYKSMFWDAAPLLRTTCNHLEKGTLSANGDLSELIKLLNKWPLAYKVERRFSRNVAEDFLLHYGVIGSEGKLEELPDPVLARKFCETLGEAFEVQLQKKRGSNWTFATLLRAAGWLYLAMPNQCYEYLRIRMSEANSLANKLSAVELHAIGLSFQSPEDLHMFYPLAVSALNRQWPPNNWLRAIRNICRFRNHALHPDVITDATLAALVENLYEMMLAETQNQNFANKFNNCLESFPFLLKRRRYDPEFMPPESKMAKKLVALLEHLDKKSHRLANRMQKVPASTLNFLCKKATAIDIGNLLGMDDGDESDGDHD
ncbi:MAG TPA: hypothetical protein VG938_14460 [Verrucomicrobiae bacterium]|jgi:hypothetical protein|nr:hypothetical protein [Verrucomicrobiae bacterium]